MLPRWVAPSHLRLYYEFTLVFQGFIDVFRQNIDFLKEVIIISVYVSLTHTKDCIKPIITQMLLLKMKLRSEFFF